MGEATTFDPSAFRDLRGTVVSPGPGPDVVADSVALLAARMREDLDELADAVVRRVVDAVPAYAGQDALAHGDLWWSCYRNAELVLTLLVEDRRPSPDELAVRRTVGVRRAQQGIAAEDLLQAFQVGYLLLWEEITQRAAHRDRVAAAQLLSRAGVIWTHMQEISASVAEAHRAEAARRAAEAQQGPSALLQALARWPVDRSAEDLARALGFDPTGPFLAARHHGSAAHAWGQQQIVVQHPDQVTVLCAPSGPHAAAEADLADALRQAGATAIGVGLTRDGLDGARASLRDADQAHAAARMIGLAQLSFRDGWFTALAVHARDALEPVVGGARQVLCDDVELRDTLRAYLDGGGRIGDTAKALQVHPNTVTYRLERLARRTGIDPRAVHGAMAARLALTLSDV